MPVHKTKGGYQYGNTGKVYKDKKKAIKQAIAIAYSKARKRGKKPSQEDITREIKGEDTVKKVSSAELNKHLMLFKAAADREVIKVAPGKPEKGSDKPAGGFTAIGGTGYDPKRVAAHVESVTPMDSNALIQYDRNKIAESAKRLEHIYRLQNPRADEASIAQLALAHAHNSAQERAERRLVQTYTDEATGDYKQLGAIDRRTKEDNPAETVHVRSDFNFADDTGKHAIPLNRLSKSALKLKSEGKLKEGFSYQDRLRRLLKTDIKDDDSGWTRKPTLREAIRAMARMEMPVVSDARGSLDVAKDPYTNKISQERLNAIYGDRFPIQATTSPLVDRQPPIIDRGPIQWHNYRDFSQDKSADWNNWQYGLGLGVGPALYHVPRFFTKTIPNAANHLWWWLSNLGYKAPEIKDYQK